MIRLLEGADDDANVVQDQEQVYGDMCGCFCCCSSGSYSVSTASYGNYNTIVGGW